MPAITRLLETSLYVADVARSVAFYRDILGFPVLLEGGRLSALDAGGGTVLLLFRCGASAEGIDAPGGRIPAHDGTGRLHLAFAVAEDELAGWEERLAARGVAIDGRMSWDRGGRSIYFRDPDGHSVELATPGTWVTY